MVVTDAQADTLGATLCLANDCRNWISQQAWAAQRFSQFDIHKMAYRKAREKFGLSAQMVVRLIAKVADSYKLDRKVMRNFQPTGTIPTMPVS